MDRKSNYPTIIIISDLTLLSGVFKSVTSVTLSKMKIVIENVITGQSPVSWFNVEDPWPGFFVVTIVITVTAS